MVFSKCKIKINTFKYSNKMLKIEPKTTSNLLLVFLKQISHSTNLVIDLTLSVNKINSALIKAWKCVPLQLASVPWNIRVLLLLHYLSIKWGVPYLMGYLQQLKKKMKESKKAQGKLLRSQCKLYPDSKSVWLQLEV